MRQEQRPREDRDICEREQRIGANVVLGLHVAHGRRSKTVALLLPRKTSGSGPADVGSEDALDAERDPRPTRGR